MTFLVPINTSIIDPFSKMFGRYLLGFAAFCAVSGFKWDRHTLRVLTNEVDSETLEYYSNLPNKLTDIALQGIRDYLVQHNDTQISIPPIDLNFTESILGFDLINGEFKANNGVFFNPATIERKGNSSMSYHLLQSNLSTVVGFRDMDVYFPWYEATVIGLSETGDVNVIVGKNEILLQVTITLLPKCTVALTNLKLSQFEDITTDIRGLGILNGLADDITAWVLSSYETSFSALIENIVANKLSEVLAKTGGFCKYKRRTVKFAKLEPRKISCLQFNGTVFKCSNST